MNLGEVTEQLDHIAQNIYEGLCLGPYHNPEVENVVSALNHVGDGMHSIARAIDEYNTLIAKDYLP